MIALLFLVGSAHAGYECNRLHDIQDEIQKHGFGFVAARLDLEDEELQEVLDRKYSLCKDEIELEDVGPDENVD